ncbi:MAG TPA: cysteine desulfurase [Candidatus Krumholzibacteria bacterium]|jgi:cysteine desulfurase/selenocysteine lyase
MTSATEVREERPERLDPEKIRRDFPALQQEVHGKPLVYLDSAATSQRPQVVIDAVRSFYEHDNANVHRGVHALSERATARYERVRQTACNFFHGNDAREFVFTKGTTESINLLAHSFVRPRLAKGDEILITQLEHHSNIVPWQLLCEETGAKLVVAPINDEGEVEMNRFEALLGDRTRFASVAHVSNALGTVNPVREMIRLAHTNDVPILIDGAQAVARMPVDFQELGCDFYALSSHKMCGPTGVGILWGRLPLLQAMRPYQGGGDMILSVSFDGTTYNEVPHRFEAGTPNIAGVIGMGAAFEYLSGIGMDRIRSYEEELLGYGVHRLMEVRGLRLVGNAIRKSGVLSFLLEGVHPHDVGTVLDREGVAVRAGHHCAQPVMERFGVAATVRASLGVYNNREDIDRLVTGLQRVTEMFRR